MVTKNIGVCDDGIVITDVKNHEIYELTKTLFHNLNFNNSKFSLILTQFHAHYKQLLKTKKINLGDDSNLTFRKIIKTIKLFDFAIKNNNQALDALIHAISDNYFQPLRSNEHKIWAVKELQK